MHTKHFFTSLTRVAGLRDRSFTVQGRDRDGWRNGDFVVGAVTNYSSFPIELDSGRMLEVARGDLLVGALGRRAATLEAVGSFEAVGNDLRMSAMTGAGLFGKITSKSVRLPETVMCDYVGHVHLDGEPAGMRDFVDPVPATEFDLPVVLIIGTSMSAGKTTTAKAVVRQLVAQGLEVVGAKLTGAGRYRDILGMRDAGAREVFDFVDVGLPSTICPADEYRDAIAGALHRMAAVDVEVAVIEAGASPLEPYNGRAAIELLREHVACLVLCASDPYAVVGVTMAFDLQPDLVCGVATSTDAGIELIGKLSGLPALNVLDAEAHGALRDLLADRLGRETGEHLEKRMSE